MMQAQPLNSNQTNFYANTVKGADMMEPYCYDQSHQHFSKNIFPDCYECIQTKRSLVGGDTMKTNMINMIDRDIPMSMSKFVGPQKRSSNLSIDGVYNPQASLQLFNQKSKDEFSLLGRQRKSSQQIWHSNSSEQSRRKRMYSMDFTDNCNKSKLGV